MGSPLSPADMMAETAPTASESERCLFVRQAVSSAPHRWNPEKVLLSSPPKHTAARKWAKKAVADGRITLDDLKRDPAACTPLPGTISPVTRRSSRPTRPPDHREHSGVKHFELQGDCRCTQQPRDTHLSRWPVARNDGAKFAQWVALSGGALGLLSGLPQHARLTRPACSPTPMAAG